MTGVSVSADDLEALADSLEELAAMVREASAKRPIFLYSSDEDVLLNAAAVLRALPALIEAADALETLAWVRCVRTEHVGHYERVRDQYQSAVAAVVDAYENPEAPK